MLFSTAVIFFPNKRNCVTASFFRHALSCHCFYSIYIHTWVNAHVRVWDVVYGRKHRHKNTLDGISFFFFVAYLRGSFSYEFPVKKIRGSTRKDDSALRDAEETYREKNENQAEKWGGYRGMGEGGRASYSDALVLIGRAVSRSSEFRSCSVRILNSSTLQIYISRWYVHSIHDTIYSYTYISFIYVIRWSFWHTTSFPGTSGLRGARETWSFMDGAL